jgi:hypothetical protein
VSEAYVDQLLAAWEERLRRVDENLLALEADPTYQVLSGAAGSRQPLEGVTRARVSPALDALAELFEQRGRLTEVLEQAKAVKDSAGFFDKEAKMAEAAALLTGPSIKMGATPVPLAQRNLLDPAAADVAVIPEHLLAAMAHAYEVARDVVMQVARAWNTLEPLIADLDREVKALRRQAEDVGDTSTVGPELAAIDRDLDAYKALVAKDPLGVESSVSAALAPRVEGVHRRIEGLAASKARVTQGLVLAEESLRELERVHAAAAAIPARVRAEFGVTSVPVGVADDAVAGLAEWCAKIEATAGAGKWHAADVGLARWQETLDSYLAADTAVASALEGLGARRVELAGRLSARRAQLAALLARGAQVDPALEGRGRTAEALLTVHPTDMARATVAVEAFEADVVTLAGRARRP